ncbi:hypothetical protein Terro_3203 [Terriglobus roseus DSM 18391]|uniref:Helix-turn-helix domain-containing protein n=1 Tax=Terriglobus roseus (strain DSM 18391 / NRRL B-41598 / KBS 63) TaxID=926566 RepID=I3ZJK5_TERRK|nr:hypothetical protein Terro_3203 [Terriglobus roseus DSM 18391]
MDVKTEKSHSKTLSTLQLVTETEAARLLATPPGTLRYWRHQGKGPNFVRLGGRVKYDLVEVIDYVDRHRHGFSARAAKGD